MIVRCVACSFAFTPTVKQKMLAARGDNVYCSYKCRHGVEVKKFRANNAELRIYLPNDIAAKVTSLADRKGMSRNKMISKLITAWIASHSRAA